ncbi:MAG: aspartate dehydrogenase [Candidatus Woesearchaeota archaeon]|nr:MAG: aspartate dehydrogenase [Candidatus Woesearchaeota archaeon]
MKRVAILGCGAIGSIIAQYIDRENFVELVGIYDINAEAMSSLKSKLKKQKPTLTESLDEILDLDPDIVIEATCPKSTAENAEKVLENCDLIILCTGILTKLRNKLLGVCERTGHRLFAPSGAIGGIDVILAIAQEGIEKISITTTKKPKSLKGYENIKKRTVVFSGPASKAIKKFPTNINVAVTLSFAAGKEAKVRIIADPKVKYNQHEVYAKSKHTEFQARIANIPSKDNPRTSQLAALSALQILKQAISKGGVKIGN